MGIPIDRTTRGREQTAPSTPTPAQAGRVEPAPGGPWTLLAADKDMRGKVVEVPKGRYPTQGACHDALTARYEPLLRLLQASPGPGRWTWSTTLPGHKPQETRAWCAETP